jgi:hypothetical protein
MTEVNTAFAELAEILLGDGCLNIYRSHAGDKIKVKHQIKVTLDSRERQYAQYVQDLIARVLGKMPLLRKRPGANAVDITLFGPHYLRALQKAGFILAPKWKRAIIPECFLKREFELWVVRGYFDTDGSVVITNNNGTIYPRLEMKVSPSPMQEQFIGILQRRDFHFGVYAIGKGKVRIQLNGKKQLKKWWDEVGFSNSRHTEKAKAFL